MRVIVSESMAVSSSEADRLKDTNKLSAGETNSHNHPDCKLPPSNTYSATHQQHHGTARPDCRSFERMGYYF